jgi:hypothetical protein
MERPLISDLLYGCTDDAGPPIEVFTATDFAEELLNASASNVEWIKRDHPELLPG